MKIKELMTILKLCDQDTQLYFDPFYKSYTITKAFLDNAAASRKCNTAGCAHVYSEIDDPTLDIAVNTHPHVFPK